MQRIRNAIKLIDKQQDHILRYLECFKIGSKERGAWAKLFFENIDLRHELYEELICQLKN